jgi:hypothetical protein
VQGEKAAFPKNCASGMIYATVDRFVLAGRQTDCWEHGSEWPFGEAHLPNRIMGTHLSTTLADLLTPLLVANPFSAVRASLR